MITGFVPVFSHKEIEKKIHDSITKNLIQKARTVVGSSLSCGSNPRVLGWAIAPLHGLRL